MSWTDEKVAKLKELWGKGKTANQIAEIIGGLSRNAVIGKAHRLNLSAKIKVIVGPMIAPKLLPAAMNPKSLFACSLLKISAIKLQNTDIFNKLKTLTQI